MKLFIAINFNTNTRSRLISLSDELRFRSKRGNFSRPENLHLTLVFLGECDVLKADRVKSIMRTTTFEPFYLTVDHLGRFKRDGGDIWWAGLQENKALIELQSALTDKLIAEGFVLSKHEYSPHITLGREVVTDIPPWSVESFGEKVFSIALVQSELVKDGLTYTTIYSTGDVHKRCDERPTSYNIRDIITVINPDRCFFDFALKKGRPLVTDYSRINREIIVNDDNSISLGSKKIKSEINSIDSLLKTLITLFLEVHKNTLDNMASGIDPYSNIEIIRRIYESENKKAVNLIVNQVVFDILYDKYLTDSPWLTLNQYCEKYVCYGWNSIPSEKENVAKPIVQQNGITERKEEYKKLPSGDAVTKPDNSYDVQATFKWMSEAIKREVKIKNNPDLKNDSILLGRNPETYLDFLEERNESYKQDKKKPKHLWDYIYYNGNPELITSKQFKRSFNKKNKNNKKSRNYSYKEINQLFIDYDRFIKAAFSPEDDNSEDYFEKSMAYYHLEIYKRIDYMYKLAVRMETASGSTEKVSPISLNRETLSVKRFHPVVFWPIEKDNCLCYCEKHKYYRPSLLLEELWHESLMGNIDKFDYDTLFIIWHNWQMFRAKVYELFNYHYKFVPDSYDDIVSFIRKDYDILTYHDPNKVWIQEGKKLKREREARIKYAMDINDALFWDSDKRKPVERQK